MLKKVVLPVLAIVLSVAFFAGCGKKQDATQESTQQQAEMQVPAALVTATKSVKLDVPWDMEYPAQVAGSLEVEIRAQVGGILTARLYNEGEYVQKDSVLFTIDPQPYKVALERAQATLAQVETEVQRTKRDYERMKGLIEDNAVSQKDYDDSLSAYEKSQADYKAAKAGVDDAKINLGYTQVKAPISGIARKENHSVGSLISIMGNESLLTTMVQIDPLYINFSIPGKHMKALFKEYEEGRVAVKDDNIDVNIILDEGKLYENTGKIIFFDTAEDPKTASIAVKAEVKAIDKGYKRDLAPGQFVKVCIRGIILKDAIVVPQSAIVALPAGGNIVYVVNTSSNNVVEAVPVESVTKDSVALVYSGLKGGETVISAGAIKVTPGAPIKYEEKEFTLPDSYLNAYNNQYTVARSTDTSSVTADFPICQSCGMQIQLKSDFGTESDGSQSKDYCRYCYKNGKFVVDLPYDKFLDAAIVYYADEHKCSDEEARKALEEKLPNLKRWKK